MRNRTEPETQTEPDAKKTVMNPSEQAVSAVQKKRGAKSASVEANLTATKPELKQMMSNVLYWYKRQIVKSDEECADRLNEFFEHVNQTGEIPTVEKMCLSLGTVRQVVWEWEQGTMGKPRSDMIKRAKEILAAIDAELVSNNKIPQVTYIFRAKNFYQMADKTEVVLAPGVAYEKGEVSDVDKVVQTLPEPDDI